MPFFMTQGLGAFNDNIFKNALAAMLVFEGSKLSALNTDQLVNFSAMVFILPFFLFSALFGQFADKYEKSLQIRRIKLFEVVIMLLARVVHDHIDPAELFGARVEELLHVCAL